MEGLSVAAFWAALATSGLATLLYAVSLMSRRLVMAGAAPGVGTVTVTVTERMPASLGRLGTAGTWATSASLGLSLAARTVATGRPPYSNMWEYTVALGFGIVLFAALFEWWYRQRTLSAFLLPVAFVLLLVAGLFFPAEVQPLVPALQANRILAAHVGTMITAYAALSVSFGAGVMYLLQGGKRRFKLLPKGSLLEEIGYRSVLIGFPVLALGVALGAWWANSAWGRYWGWDPKETSALVTWLVYAGYIHMRGLRGWKGTRSAWMLVVGFAAVLFTYFGVNLWVIGLHSYAGV